MKRHDCPKSWKVIGLFIFIIILRMILTFKFILWCFCCYHDVLSNPFYRLLKVYNQTKEREWRDFFFFLKMVQVLTKLFTFVFYWIIKITKSINLSSLFFFIYIYIYIQALPHPAHFTHIPIQQFPSYLLWKKSLGLLNEILEVE